MRSSSLAIMVATILSIVTAGPTPGSADLLFGKRQETGICPEGHGFIPLCCKGNYGPYVARTGNGACFKISSTQECQKDPADNGSGAKVYCCTDFDDDKGAGIGCHTPVGTIQSAPAANPVEGGAGSGALDGVLNFFNNLGGGGGPSRGEY